MAEKKYLDLAGLEYVLNKLPRYKIHVVIKNEELAASEIRCESGSTVYTKIIPSIEPYDVEFTVNSPGKWKITAGDVSTTCEVEGLGVTTVSLDTYSYRGWLKSIGKSENLYSSLEDLLADEKMVRELITRHASVDYLVEWLTYSDKDSETVLGDFNVCKWINLRDYALDKLEEVESIKAVMDEIGLYGYGEVGLVSGNVGTVPAMTSNTTPEGEAFASSQFDANFAAWKAFNGKDEGTWHTSATSVAGQYIGYKFKNPIRITKLFLRNGSQNRNIASFKVQASNDGSNWTDITGSIGNSTSNNNESYYKFETNLSKYSYYRIYVLSGQTSNFIEVSRIQFYDPIPEPVGNVPVMTSNTAPYGEVTTNGYHLTYYPYLAFNGAEGTYGSATYYANYSDGELTYKFVNPTKVNRFKTGLIQNNDNRVETITLYASNDNSNWTNLGTYTPTQASSTAPTYDMFNVDNDNYYLYYRAYFKAGSLYVGVSTLQFYGRELKNLVPIMTSNTTPNGRAFAKASRDGGGGQNNLPYLAFDKKATASGTQYGQAWGGSCGAGNYVGYEFEKPTEIIMAISTSAGDGGSRANYRAKIQASDNEAESDWEDFSDIVNCTGGNNKNTVIPFTQKATKKMYRMMFLDTTQNDSYCFLKELQLYGLDYSEREFEEGSTIKYIYDHGVELTEIGSNGDKEESALYLANIKGASMKNAIDFTPIKLVRIIVGKRISVASNGAYIGIGTCTTGEDKTEAFSDGLGRVYGQDLPNNVVYDVSNINSLRTITINSGISSNYLDVVEWWLE